MSSSRLRHFAQITLRRHTLVSATCQALLITFSLLLSWMLRFDLALPDKHALFIATPCLILIRLIMIDRFGLLHGWWRYVGIEDVVDIIKAVACGSVGFFLTIHYILRVPNFPRSVYLLEGFMTAGLLAGVRVFSRLLVESFRQNLDCSKQVVVIGAGFGAQLVIRELHRPQSGCQVVACFDDDLKKVGGKFCGVPVAGTVSQLPEFVASKENCEIIIAIPSATKDQMRRLVDICEQTERRYRTVPMLRELIAGHVITQLRPVGVEELLGRDPVMLNTDDVQLKIAGRVVMVTGAAGSIGSELCRQILEFAPRKVVCVDTNETGLFYLQLELTRLGTASEVLFCVGDVRDGERMRDICFGYTVDSIFHAAAYKHVPMMELNVHEAVNNNIFGLCTLLEVAEEAGCTDLILISSDKAVNPSSIMGATKRVCELLVVSRPANGLRCVSVRFGNVLGSSGSVVPIFQEQISQNRPLTVTHPEMKRFFMTIQEAVSLVLQAFAIGQHGDLLVLDMGTPIKIVDLARRLIRLSGKSEEDVPIEFTGLRDGEKLYEELFYDNEDALPTAHPKIKQTQSVVLSWPELMTKLTSLRSVLHLESAEGICARIQGIVPEYCFEPRAPTPVYTVFTKTFDGAGRGSQVEDNQNKTA
jgi:FlaA1/EpsC-like NDP-sugar epimerase